MHGIEVITNVTRDRRAWLGYKNKTLGSSEIAVILGVNPYESRQQLWEKKTGKRQSFAGNNHTRRGTRLEPAVLKYLEEDLNEKNRMHPVHVVQPDIMYVHPTYEWASASPDAYVVNSAGSVLAIAEAKAPAMTSVKHWKHGAPIYYEYQLKWQMGVIGIEKGCIVRWFVDLGTEEEFAHHWYQHSEEEFKKILEEGAAFMEAIKSDTPPAPKPIYQWGRPKPKADTANVKRLQPTDLVLIRRYQEIAMEAAKIRAQIAPLEKEQKAIRDKLIELVGEDTTAQLNGVKIEVKTVKRAAQEESEYTKLTVSEG